MNPDVPFREGTQYRVAYGMEKHIPVGVAEKTFPERDLDASQDKPPAICQPMDVEPSPYPHKVPLSWERSPLAMVRSSGVVIFMLYGEPSMTFTFFPRCSMNVASSYP